MVRALDGVSLFDFADFDANQYERDYPASSWSYFVPHHRSWGVAVWIEIDREFVATSYRSPSRLLHQWKTEERWSQRIMPGIEAAHIGSLPVAAFKSAFISWDEGREVRDLSLDSAHRPQLLRTVEEWRASNSESQ